MLKKMKSDKLNGRVLEAWWVAYIYTNVYNEKTDKYVQVYKDQRKIMFLIISLFRPLFSLSLSPALFRFFCSSKLFFSSSCILFGVALSNDKDTWNPLVMMERERKKTHKFISILRFGERLRSFSSFFSLNLFGTIHKSLRCLPCYVQWNGNTEYSYRDKTKVNSIETALWNLSIFFFFFFAVFFHLFTLYSRNAQ